MGAKPSTLPRWADVGGAIVVPSSGKLDVGWVSAERPPAQYLNWYQNLVYLWIVFVGAYFTNGGAATGATDIGKTAEATVTPTSVWRDYAQRIRTVIDHNGYRMGQLSEIDENWVGGPVTVDIPLSAMHIVTGAPILNTDGQIKFTAASQVVHLGLTNHIPRGAIVTSIVVRYHRTTAGDNFTISARSNGYLSGDAGSGTIGGATQTVSSGTGDGTIDLLTGGKRFAMPPDAGNPSQHVYLNVSTTTVTTADWIKAVAVTYYVLPPGWTSTLKTLGESPNTGGDRYAYVDPDANINHRSLQIIGHFQSGASATSAEVFGPFECFHDANCAFSMEFMLRTGTITGGTNNRLFAAGIQNNNGAALNRFVYFYNENTTANWQLRVVGSATADTDTGVAIAANTTYRMRLEIYGSNVHTSGNTKVRAYINGVKVAEVNVSTLPVADMIRPYFKAGTTSAASGPFDYRVGRVARRWNHLLTSDNL